MITSEDLVSDLGLSRTAISQIINGKGRYAPETRQRVLARVRELGYTPHAGARAARLKRFETLVLFNASPFWQGLPHPGLYEGCMEGCAAGGYRLLLETITAAGMPGLAARSNLLGQRMCDGLLMNYHLPPPEDLQRLVRACGVPVVWLNVRLPEACLLPDDAAAARHVASTLLARGRRRIAYVDGGQHDYGSEAALAEAHYSVAERWHGVRDVLADAGLGLRHLAPGSLAYGEQLRQARALLAGPDRPDALVCYNEIAAQLMLLAMAESGLVAGRDISVVQFSETPYLFKRPVATAVIPFRELGATATRLLIAAAASGTTAIPAQRVPFTYALEETL